MKLGETKKIRIEAKDAYGEEVKDIKYFTVYSNAAKEVPSNETNWYNYITNRPLEPGEKAKFVIGSKEENIKVKINYFRFCQPSP